MNARILVVEDDKIWRKIFKRELEKRMYQVDLAVSLEEALEKIQPGAYHVVVTDIGLTKSAGNKDGIDVLRAVRARAPGTITIAVSGRTPDTDREQFERDYQTLVFLERDILYRDLETFVAWVGEGVARSQVSGNVYAKDQSPDR